MSCPSLKRGTGKRKWQIDGVMTSTLLQRHIYLDDPLSLSPAESNLTTFLSHFQNIEFIHLQSSTSTLIMSLPYPTVYQIEEMFANRLDHNTFHTYLAKNPDLTVVGKRFPPRREPQICRVAAHRYVHSYRRRVEKRHDQTSGGACHRRR